MHIYRERMLKVSQVLSKEDETKITQRLSFV